MHFRMRCIPFSFSMSKENGSEIRLISRLMGFCCRAGEASQVVAELLCSCNDSPKQCTGGHALQTSCELFQPNFFFLPSGLQRLAFASPLHLLTSLGWDVVNCKKTKLQNLQFVYLLTTAMNPNPMKCSPVTRFGFEEWPCRDAH